MTGYDIVYKKQKRDSVDFARVIFTLIKIYMYFRFFLPSMTMLSM